MKNFSSLLKHASFFALEEKDFTSSCVKEFEHKFHFDSVLDRLHPERKKDFILGRLCASRAYELCTGKELLSLEIESGGRAPLWPLGSVGSISHSKHIVGAVVADSNKVLGLGVDFETKARVKLSMAKMITTKEDITSHAELSEIDVLTIIFSAKESLYKALYPKVKKFFGFEVAAVTSIDVNEGSFKIELIIPLNLEYGPGARSIFLGRFSFNEKSLMTVIEIPH